MMLADYLRTLPPYELADIYDTLYQPGVPVQMSDEGYRTAVAGYWSDPINWNTFVDSLSPMERKRVTRLALHEKCPIDAFLEKLNGLGILMLDRSNNRYEVCDDVRMQLLERLPSLEDVMRAQERSGDDGVTGV